MQRPPLQRPSPSHQSQGCAARANLAVVAPPAMAPQAGCSRTRRRDKRRERCQGACAPRRPPGPVAVYEHARGPGQSLRSLSGASRVRHARGGEKRRSFRLFSVLGTYRYRAARGRPVGPPRSRSALARFHWKLWSTPPALPGPRTPRARHRCVVARGRLVASAVRDSPLAARSRRSTGATLCARGGRRPWRRRRVSRTAVGVAAVSSGGRRRAGVGLRAGSSDLTERLSRAL